MINSFQNAPRIRSEPTVSVLMPVRNPDPGMLRTAVASVLKQTFPEFELIIIEDPGERSAGPIIESLDDDHIIYRRNEDTTGLSEQRNKALSLARGKFVALMDSDDISLPSRLQRQVDFLLRNPDIDIVGSQIELIDSLGKAFARRPYPTTHSEIDS